MATVYKITAYTLQESADHFCVHITTVSERYERLKKKIDHEESAKKSEAVNALIRKAREVKNQRALNKS